MTNNICTAKTFVSQTVMESFSHWRQTKFDRVIYNGIDVMELSNKKYLSQTISIRQEFKLQNKYIITTVGRLIPEKNHELTLKIIKKLLFKIKDVHLLIVGAGPYRNKIKLLMKQLGISSFVSFTGFRENVSQIISQSDLILNPSLREGFSMTMLEALACGTPFIGSALPQNEECITSGFDGILIDSSQCEEYVSYIQKIYENKQFYQSIVINGKKE